jgi:hypothetical protein
VRVGVPVDGGDLESVDALAQSGRHHLADGRERPERTLLDPGDSGGRGLQRHRDGDRLVVVEQ